MTSAVRPLASRLEPALKPIPAEEEEAGAGQHEGQVVRRHQVLAVAHALAEHDGADEAGDTGVDVHDGAAGEVDGAPG